mgnify:CR=1 FL=1
MNPKNSKTVLIFSGAATLLLLLVFFWGFRNIRERGANIALLKNKVSEASAEDSLIRSLATLKRSAGEELDAFNNRALTDNNLVSLIESLEDKASSLGLDLEIVSVNKTANESLPLEVEFLNIVIDADGSWRGVYSFLLALESLPHRVIFEKVNFSKREGHWNLNVAFSAYIFKDDE